MTATHIVVINDEEQYSLWPISAAIPPGWRAIGEPATEAGCLDYIEKHWTDMRPRSARLAGSGGDTHRG